MSERDSPVARNVVLLVGFVALVIIGVFTVLLPALEDTPEDAQADESSETADDE